MVFAVAAVAATCGKIARELIELSRPEISELQEPEASGRGASSTMPQKRNPISSEAIVAMSVLAIHQVPALLTAMQGGHEQSAGEWQIETEIAILLHLAQHKVKVSSPIDRTDAQVLAPLDCPEGRRFAALFTAAPGKEVDREAYTDELAAAYGEAAATIHSAADDFKGRPLRPALELEYALVGGR